MSSLLTGYNYDIFISYRQKDNRGDHWVTDFVEALKTELDATFKEEITVYFDSNPHDGLLETHDVDASLKEKLKCLIFIPIISRTYCDPKSFAWEHEFKAFIEMAANDSFGLKVSLPNGNVASRVLPIRIHQLEPEDNRLLEGLLGFLRPVDFIYQTSGVNRPLRQEDSRADNDNKQSVYRDQINKVALAARNIMKAVISGTTTVDQVDRAGIITTTVSVSLKQNSILVLPFDNISPDPDQEYFSDGLTEEIITDLSYIHELMVISRSSAMTFKGSKKTIPEIAREVNVHYVLEGSVRKAGTNLRITAQLIDALTDTHVWAEKYNGTLDDVFGIQEKVAQSIAKSMKVRLSETEASKLAKVPISNVASYELYLKAKSYLWTFSESGIMQALKLTIEALNLSTDSALLYATRALIYWQLHNAGFSPTPDTLELAEKDAQKALELDSRCSVAYSAIGYIAYTKGEMAIAGKKLIQASEYEINGESLSMAGYVYALAGVPDLPEIYVQKALQADPLNDIVICGSSFTVLLKGEYDRAAELLMRAEKLNPSNHMGLYYYALTRVYCGEQQRAIETHHTIVQRGNSIFSEISKLWLAALRKNEEDFRTPFETLKEYALRDKELSWWFADCLALMGHVEDAFNWLGNAIELGFFNSEFYSKYDSILSAFKSHPDFISVMNKARDRQISFNRASGIES
jgi:TolB-like protein/tetratricopeptide (TPR) repeat protein